MKKNTIIKEKSKIQKSENDDSENLSSAYQNINVLLSNCLESIRKEEIDNDRINSPVYRNLTNTINKQQISSGKMNNLIKSSFRPKKTYNLDKSNSLSNSNIVLIKNSEDNLLKSLNIDSDKNNINRKKTSPLKITKKKTNQSETTYRFNVKNNILDKTVNKKFTKNNTLVNSHVKLKQNNKTSKYLLFGKKKEEFEKENSQFNIKEINKKFSIKNKNTKSSLKTNLTLKGKNKKKIDINAINMKYNSNLDSPKSIKQKRSKKVTFREAKIKRRKIKLNTLDSIKKIYKKQLTMENNHIHLSKKNLLSYRKNKSSKYLTKINSLKRPNTEIIPLKINENILLNYIKKKSVRSNKPIKNSKKNLKLLTLEQIGENVKQSLILFNLTDVKKELYDLENNDISEAIKNLPSNNFGDNKKETLISQKDNNNIIKSCLNNSIEIYSENSEEGAKNINIFQQKYRKLFVIKKVYDSLDDEEIGDEEEEDNFYLSPNSFPVYFIDSLVLFSSFIELLYLPFFLGYKTNFCRNTFSTESIIFYSIDFVYIFDLITGFFKGYYNFEEVLIKNNIKIVINYLKGWFIFDFIEAIPIYTFFNFNEKKCSLHEIHYFSTVDSHNFRYSFLIIKVLKIFKTFSDNKAMNKFIDLLNTNDFFHNWNGVFYTILILFSLIHFFSCIFIYLGKVFQPGWIAIQNIQDKTFNYIYITAIYYLITTLTTVGYGDISVLTTYERLYQIILLIVGTCAYSWILTFISNYIKKMNEQYIDFENKVKILRDIKISYPLLPKELYDKVIRYLKYNKAENKINIDYILDSLPFSLKNNVIIDMYKPIIKNFQFFKSFQNSDFFVKIVTSLKPVLSLKDDILVQEGDLIEDIIFIKKGVLSLEICIDLDCPQECCEIHLSPNGLTTTSEQQQTLKTGRGNISHSMASSNININKINTHSKKQNMKSNRKYINVINLRKNEHYGDILMILNERSPFTVKVKSKKAELFFLQKTEATEISNKYPNIWKRIVHKSSYNMRQIKNIMKKKIIIFCDLNGISINPEIKKNANNDISEVINSINESFFQPNKSKSSSKNDSNKKKKKNSINNQKKYSNLKNKNNQIDSIIYEVDENIESNRNSFAKSNINNASTKNIGFRFSNKKERNSNSSNFLSSKNIKSGIKSFLNKSNHSHHSFKKNSNIKEHKKEILHFNSESNSSLSSKRKSSLNNKEFTSDSMSEGEDKETNRNNSNKSDKTNKNKDLESNKNFNLINNKLNKMLAVIEEKMKMKTNSGLVNINFFNNKTYNIPINHINRRFSAPNILINSYEDNEVNEEIYSNEDFNINLGKENLLFKNSDKNTRVFYPYLNIYNNSKNNTNEFNLSRILEKNKSKLSLYKEEINSKSSKNSDLIKLSGFSNLFATTSISFTINSSYENMNKLTGFKLSKDNFLLKKIKNYILDECFFQTNTSNYNKKNNFYINSPIGDVKTKKSRMFGSVQPRKVKNNLNSNILGKNNSFLGNIKTDGEESKNKKITLRHSLKLRQKRIYSIDNISSANKFKQKSVETEKVPKYKKSRESPNFKQFSNIFFMNYSLISNKHNASPSEDVFFKKRTSKRSALKLNDEEEMSFYTKMKTIRKNNNNFSINSLISKPKKFDLMEQITHNIQKNKQNLNNPEEYFSGFFSNILQRRKTIWRKSNKTNKKVTNNISNIKRTSTSSEAIHRNNRYSKFKI